MSGGVPGTPPLDSPPMRFSPRLTVALGVAAVVGVAWRPAARACRFLWRSWQARVAIAGRSMEPALEDGDWVLVDPDAFRTRPPLLDDLVLAPDPRVPERLIIKRVGGVSPDGLLTVLGDAPDASTDSRVFGAVHPATIRGRPWFRYWPPRRTGRLR
jgi:nickel-type superoxide dismutase maturation protease